MELTLDQALQKGIEAHKLGKVQEADRYYTAILKANPKHSDANHNMGVLAVGVGKIETALPFFKTALEADSSITQYWLSYIDALIKLDRIADAKDAFDQGKSKGAKGVGFDQLELQLDTRSVEVNNKATEDALNNSNILDEFKLSQALKLAKKKVKDGLSEEAKHIYQDILKKFPKNKKALDAMKTLLSGSSIKNLNVREPIIGQIQPIINLYNQGQLQDALSQASKLLKQFPNSINLFNILGAVNQGLGRPEEAVKAYAYAIDIQPNYADAHNNMGVALKDQGKLEEATEAYTKALSLKPAYADVHNNMGVVLKSQGKLEEAIEAYKKAISLKPDFAEGYYNMGVALQEQGKLEEAIKSYGKTLSIRPDYGEACANIGFALQGVTFNKPNRGVEKIIYSLLHKNSYVQPMNIAPATISLLKFEPNLQMHLQVTDGKLISSLLEVIADLNKLPLLLKLMKVCPLPDLELERLLINLRCLILSYVLETKDASTELLNFQSALALQCFTNEYIFNHTKEEEEKLQTLENIIKKGFETNDQPSPQAVLTLASYKALHQYEWCNWIVVTDHIQEVFNRQVDDAEKERDIKSQITVLEEITDKVSSKVRNQYEKNPYPRWVNMGFSAKPISISLLVDEIKLRLYNYRINAVEKPEILIAGCGTGQHSMRTATRFKSSKVLAIDLSLSSLAYAKRKTEELGITNIQYLQADILDLKRLNKQFDLIESVGVLHHMETLLAGWRELTDCLKEGGLMKIGLYSELARQDVVKIREEISQLSVGASDAEIKAIRDTIIGSGKSHHKRIMGFADFFSLSELKDLLFHVQEHRLTIPMIKDHLDKLGLKFCGFEAQNIVSQFKQTNTNKGDPYDLDKWQAYEEANPRTFVGMYQFWCQKIE